jgi:D-citramalate synthase
MGRKSTPPQKTASNHFEVMDTTLRDGEQTQGVSMIAQEKITIARMLLEAVKVDRIEVASARVSKGEHTTVGLICDWAKKHKLLDRVEILGFVDHKVTVDWAVTAGCKVINLLTKGSQKHCETQLGKTVAQHLDDIARTIKYGVSQGVTFNIYLEDWSGGMLHSPAHVTTMIEGLRQMDGIRRIMLPDTLGLLEPRQVREFVGEIVQRYPDQWFDFHAHNDYGLATSNCLEALRAGARAIHTTINARGERAGNVALDEIVVAAKDFTKLRCHVDEKKLGEVAYLTQVFTGKRVAWNKPIIGEDVFTQTAGIHADGDKKGNLYESRLTPQRFGRARTYAMGKLMGKASLDFNLKKLGIELSEEQKALVLARIVELADTKKVATSEDLPFIISDVLQTPESRLFEVKDFMIVSNRGLQPVASVLVDYKGQEYQATASGDGGYDAFMKALRTLASQLKFELPRLIDYTVRIPPGGKTNALVETTITWEGGLKTRGVNSDQLVAAIMATSHVINMVATQSQREKKISPRSVTV